MGINQSLINTLCVKVCGVLGNYNCDSCNGKGRIPCPHCNSFWTRPEYCTHCGNSQKLTCNKCGGTGHDWIKKQEENRQYYEEKEYEKRKNEEKKEYELRRNEERNEEEMEQLRRQYSQKTQINNTNKKNGIDYEQAAKDSADENRSLNNTLKWYKNVTEILIESLKRNQINKTSDLINCRYCNQSNMVNLVKFDEAKCGSCKRKFI